MKKWCNLLVLAISFVIFLSSCQEEEIPEKRFSAAYVQEIPNLDVQNSTNRTLRDALSLVYDLPFAIDEDGEVYPLLVSRYSIDGSILSMTVKDDVHFHDGTLLEPQDMLVSLNRWLDVNSGISAFLSDARFSLTDNGILSIEASGVSFLPYMMATSPNMPVIMPAEVIEELEDVNMPITKVIGTGPYELYSFDSSLGLEIKRSEIENFSRHPYFDTLRFDVVPSSLMRRLGLESGKYDFISEVMADDIPAFEENDDISLLALNESESLVVVYNLSSELLSNAWMREAIALAMDREEILLSVYGPYGYRVDSSYMGLGPFHIDEDPYKERDVERARKILEENGYASEDVKILVPNFSNMDDAALALSENLKEAGIESSVRVSDWVGFLSLRSDPSSFDLFISGYSDVPLPSLKQYLKDGYPGGFSDDRGYLEALSKAEGEEEMIDIWKEGQDYFFSEVPFSVIGHYGAVYAYRSDIENLSYLPGKVDFSAIRRK